MEFHGYKVDFYDETSEGVSIKHVVLTREHILNQVWGNAYMQGTRSVDRCVKTPRKKIEIDSKNPQWITTVRQVGYLYTGAS